MDINTRFCGCQDTLRANISSSTKMIQEYTGCRNNPANHTGADIDTCVTNSLIRQGFHPHVAGTTSQSGQINITPTTGTCGAIKDKATFVHEFGHQNHVRELEARFGIGTSAFNTTFNSATDWADDEINSHSRDIDFSNWAIGILENICPPSTPTTQQPAQQQPAVPQRNP
jgi:hypothetical protein